MPRPLKILHVLDHSIPLHSGYTFRTRAILREQQKRGWETVMVTSTKHNESCPEPVEPYEELEGLRFYRSTPSRLDQFPVLNQLGVVRSLEKRLKEVIVKEKPDIIHAHSPCLNGIAAMRAAAGSNLPVVYEMRASWEDAAVSHGTCREGDMRYRFSRALETYVLRRVDQITTICQGLKRDISVRGIDENRITVIPNAVDVEKFEPAIVKDSELEASLGLQHKFVIGFIGSFYEYEGLEDLVKAMAIVVEKHADVHCLLVGGGQAETALKALIESLDLGGYVTFTGRVPHADVNAYYSLIDLLAYPRLPIRLTDIVTPLKPLEAMAMGKPLLASDVGGHKELIHHNDNGFLFKAGSSKALADEIIRIKEGAALNDVIDSGLATVRHERNWQRSVSNYVPVYRSALEKVGSPLVCVLD